MADSIKILLMRGSSEIGNLQTVNFIALKFIITINHSVESQLKKLNCSNVFSFESIPVLKEIKKSEFNWVEWLLWLKAS